MCCLTAAVIAAATAWAETASRQSANNAVVNETGGTVQRVLT